MDNSNIQDSFSKQTVMAQDAEQYYGMALWYAWGRIDSGQYQGFPLDAFRFAYIVKQKRLTFLKGNTGMFESIQGQWEDFVAKESS